MKLLLEHLKNNRDALLQTGAAVNIAKHTVNLGTAREGLISNFIKQNLPEYISYHTGEVFDSKDNRSGQIDIILHPITAPKINLHNTINIFPAETVLAALEVKSTLTTGIKSGALADALRSCEKLKQLEFAGHPRERTSFVDTDKIPFIVFAYKGPTLETLTKRLAESEITPRSLPDLIVVLDRGYCLAKTNSWQFAGGKADDLYRIKKGGDAVLLGLYEYVLRLVERWFSKPSEKTMPIGKYTHDLPSSIWEIFGDQ